MTELTMGQRIAERRKLLNLSQEALGEKMGVSRQAISKWESDGAIPEVDKLIALSKLFGVSVGWLLGVEEIPNPQHSPEISEELLYKVEQIVNRCQPKKPPITWKIVLAAICVAVLLLGAFSFRSKWTQMQQDVASVIAQVHNSNTDNAEIMAKLNALEDQIAEPVEPKAVSLTSYDFELEINEDDASAMLHFHAVPSHWHEDYKATFVVEQGKKEYVSQACYWSSSGLRSTVKVDIQNGYRYYLLVEFPDGTMEQTVLYDTEAENIKQVLTILIEVNQGVGKFDLAANTLTLVDYDIYLEPPLPSGGYYPGLRSGKLILFLNRDGQRQEADTYSLFGEKDFSSGNGQPDAVSSIHCYPNGPFTLPELKDGDGLELWISVESNNGLAEKQLINAWAYVNGEFIASQPVA